MLTMPTTLGLDIGGANLKAAHANGAARTVPFALWRHPDRLGDELTRLRAMMPAHDRLALTMTGELCDCFPTKKDGVRAILHAVRGVTDVPTHVWCAEGRFLAFDDALERPQIVAAANWLALATWAARRFPEEHALLVDAGSTTTDIIYLRRGVPEPRGRTDLQRLASGELVYTGIRRTPICAVLGMEVAAEFFATMLDAYLLLGLIAEDAHDLDTADGRPATREGAHARIARLRCADAEAFSEADAVALAERAVQTQCRAVRRAIEQVCAGRPPVERIIASGSGEILVRRVLGPDAPPWTSLAELLGGTVSEAACAFAVAVLAEWKSDDR